AVQALRQPPPHYPATARRRGLEGRVLLRVRVNASGEVETVEVLDGSGAPSLDDAATEAVRRWSFRPAQRLGVAVAAVVDVPVRFRLNDP
ncbi:energy transducer TonB, partial [bacterium]|nr:energy transducer TonB [bacterium]